MCTSNKMRDFGLHSCLIKSKQAINKREFYRGASVGHVGLKWVERSRKEGRIWKTSETTVHDITYYEYNVTLFKCDGRNRLAQGGVGVTARNEIL